MRPLILAVLIALGLAAPAFAEPTTITVRALAKDAKFIGTSMGGVEVTLTDVKGKVLAKGRTEGGTGDTDRLMVKPRLRGERLAGEGDAAFTATIDIDKPTLVLLKAEGPARPAGGAVTVSSSAWILPGKSSVGDGWIIEFPGLTIDPTVRFEGQAAVLTANVTLMCGCPLTPGGLWNSDDYEVEAVISAAPLGAPDRRVKLTYAGKPSTFSVTIEDAPGAFSVLLTAYDRKTGNTGVVDFAPIRPPPTLKRDN
ncbi:hypothetical protein [Caulobacter sp. NIBR1757]|uniref:hypothetical protein n=1 Tax=Caulobacter sp. NIBR1757 TaxID=3016000 RepID=UPI0022F05343|nr:hypothetical protein [Caulobacter sp. NIBR1757]WGM39452.1 hypothetical protein AMEJIAPC_02372 [Caulobacter sp. NIBR1757]